MPGKELNKLAAGYAMAKINVYYNGYSSEKYADLYNLAKNLKKSKSKVESFL